VVNKDRYIRDYDDEYARTHPFIPAPTMLFLRAITSRDGVKYYAPINTDGLIVTRQEWAALSEAVAPFHNWMPDSVIAAQNASMLAYQENSGSGSLYDTLQNERSKQMKHGFVYVLQAGEFYKIGRSRNVDNRIMQLSTIPPFELELVCAIATDDMYELEKLLHERFDNRRVRGEWFALTEEDVTWLKTR